MFQQQAGVNYIVIGANTVTNNQVTFSGKGIVVNADTGDIQVFGGATSLVSNTKTSIINSTADSSVQRIVNGNNITPDISQWSSAYQAPVKSSAVGCLASFDSNDNTVTLVADGPGFVIYTDANGTDLIIVSFQFTTNTIAYGTKVDKGYTSVHFNNVSYMPGTDLFRTQFNVASGKKHDTITLVTGAQRTENLYVEYVNADTGASNVVEFSLEKISLNPVLYSTTTGIPPLPTIFQNYKCTIQGSADATATGVNVTVSRPSGAQQVAVAYSLVNDTVLATSSIIVPFYHKLQIPTIDYTQWKNITSVRDSNGKSLSLTFNLAPSTTATYTLQLDDNTIYQSVVSAVLVPYSEKTASLPLTYDSISKTVTLGTQNCYMINGTVYSLGGSNTLSFVTEDFTKSTFTVNLSPAVNSFGYYTNGVWNYTNVRLKPKFNPEYTYNIFTAKDCHIDLNTFGVKDSQAVVKFLKLVDGGSPKEVKHGKLAVEVPSKTVPGNLIATFKIHVDVDLDEFDFDISIYYESFQRVNFLVPNDQYFGASPNGSMRRKTLSGKFTFGNFVTALTDICYAYNVGVDATGSVDECYGASNLYPVVTFATDALGTVIVGDCGCPLTTGIIVADTTYPMTSSFNKLNNCTHVTVSSSGVTVPSTAGTCFFRIDNSIYLLRPANPTTVGLPPSGASSAAASQSATPTNNDSSSPAPSSPSPAPVSVPAPAPSVAPAVVRRVGNAVKSVAAPPRVVPPPLVAPAAAIQAKAAAVTSVASVIQNAAAPVAPTPVAPTPSSPAKSPAKSVASSPPSASKTVSPAKKVVVKKRIRETF